VFSRRTLSVTTRFLITGENPKLGLQLIDVDVLVD